MTTWRATLASLAAVTGLMTATTPARASPTAFPASASAAFFPFISEAAVRFELPGDWISAVLHAESGGDAHAVSRAGALGLMQLMPATWSAFRQRLNLGVDPFDPHDNILAGAAYLRDLYDRYGRDGFLAAYNAGPARYEAHARRGVALPAETQAYLALLSRRIGGVSTVPAANAPFDWRGAPLFAARAATGTPAPPPATLAPQVAPAPALFATLSVGSERP